MTTCLNCKSTRVKAGKLTAESAVVFQPYDLRPWTFSWLGGTLVDDKAYACLDCGLICGSTSPVELSEFVRKRCVEDSGDSAAS